MKAAASFKTEYSHRPGREARCCIEGCTIRIPDDLIMCGPHWGMVPTKLRLEYLRVLHDDFLVYEAVADRAQNAVMVKLGLAKPLAPAPLEAEYA